ncbi:hypothetical protein A6R68_10713 [Neotoma lepida]|uniref:Transcription elongation factor A protein-like 8 n=2 Tax=Muroidea TaxID=337687 RepID=A0A1A6FYD3_NEOLE|nr:hypothetical protein A6R68_10713 [Neotoma lepida]
MTRSSRDQQSTCAEVLIVQAQFLSSKRRVARFLPGLFIFWARHKSRCKKRGKSSDTYRINLFKKEILNMQKSCDENEGTAQNTPKADEGRPSEDPPQQAGENLEAPGESVGEEADGSLQGEPAQPSLEPKEDTPTRHLNPEEVIRGVDELERLREEIRRVRNKFVMMHWKQRHSRSRPYPVCFRP